MAARALCHPSLPRVARRRAQQTAVRQLPGRAANAWFRAASGPEYAAIATTAYAHRSPSVLDLCAETRRANGGHSRHRSGASTMAVLGSASAAAVVAALASNHRQVYCDSNADYVIKKSRSKKTLRVEGIQPGEDVILAADCGGTTTRLKLYAVDPSVPIVEKEQPPGREIFAEEYPNILFKSFEKIIQTFFDDAAANGFADLPRPKVACFAIAGIVTANQCRYTNLDWIVSGAELAELFGIGRVEIINDFVAQGYGVLTLSDDEKYTLNDATPLNGAPIAVLGAGTGLGVTFLTIGEDGHYDAYPSEAGHMEFAPRGEGSNELQLDLLKHLKIKVSGYTRVSTERVVSGKGICNVYEFLAYKYPDRTNEHVHEQFSRRPTDTSIIATNSWPGSLCEEALKIFASCYGAFTGTIAITLMPFKGVYLTGGVTKKLQDWLVRDGSFMKAYRDKGRVSTMLSGIPLYLVRGEDMGQRGAHLRSVRLLKEYNASGGKFVDDDQPAPMDLVAPRDIDHAAAELARLVTSFQDRRQKAAKIYSKPEGSGHQNQ